MEFDPAELEVARQTKEKQSLLIKELATMISRWRGTQEYMELCRDVMGFEQEFPLTFEHEGRTFLFRSGNPSRPFWQLNPDKELNDDQFARLWLLQSDFQQEIPQALTDIQVAVEQAAHSTVHQFLFRYNSVYREEQIRIYNEKGRAEKAAKKRKFWRNARKWILFVVIIIAISMALLGPK